MDSVKSETENLPPSLIRSALRSLDHGELAGIIMGAGGDVEKVKLGISLAQHAEHNPLRQLRKEHGYTQGDVSDKVGVSRMTCANYESGKHSPRLGFLLNYIEGLLSMVGKRKELHKADLVWEYIEWYEKKRSLTLTKSGG